MAKPGNSDDICVKRPPDGPDSRTVAPRALAWFDTHGRPLPWRVPNPDPYAIWLSEIMAQQTTLVAMRPYWERFLERWPTVHDLAAADRDDVLRAWAGLGYYARARNLHACAQAVAHTHGGRFPDTAAGLQALPGIGPYTAGAIAAICFGEPAPVVDGNVERLMARLYAVIEPLPKAKPALRRLTAACVPRERPGDFAQATMDLGSVICTPRAPRCDLCPFADDCAARAAGIAERLPAKAPKSERPVRHGVAFWLVDGTGSVLLRQRPDDGLLGGMMELPGTPWLEAAAARALDPAAHAPAETDWRVLPGQVRHIFSHFGLDLRVWAARIADRPPVAKGARWCPVDALGGEALPSVMRKAVAHALAHVGHEDR